MPNVKRGRSQVLFKYLPGSVFLEDGFWYKVENLRLRELPGKTKHLLSDIYKFVRDWTANNDLEHNLYPDRDEMYFFGEIEEVNCELFPLVFYCTNYKCLNTHSYRDIDQLLKQNPQLTCEFCKKGKLKQYPYALVHANGDIQPIQVKLNNGSTWWEKHDGIRMNDTRRFTTATWFNYKTGKSLGELGTKITGRPITKKMKAGNKRFLGGTHLAEGIKSEMLCKNSTLVE